MTHDEMIAVITHHKNGGEVECRCKRDGVWIRECHLDVRGFNFANFDYRAKPEPLAIWAEIIGNKHIARYTLTESKPCMGGVIKKFVEVDE